MANFAQLHMRAYPDPGALVWRGSFIHNWFSNFDAVGAPVEYRGFRTPRLELAFVAAKNPDQIVPHAAGRGTTTFIERIFSASTPGEAKRLGARKERGGIVDLRDDWDDVNIAAMDCFLRQRWQPDHADSRQLAAMQAPIVEWNNWRDNRWGATHRDRRGQNALGLLLDTLVPEILSGHVAPGADEAHWHERQSELVATLNAMSPETVVAAGAAPTAKAAAAPAPARGQLSLF